MLIRQRSMEKAHVWIYLHRENGVEGVFEVERICLKLFTV